MTTIVCYDSQANPVMVEKEAIFFRPAAYAVYIENNEVLLLHEADTNLLRWPGGILASGETPVQAVSRTYHRLTGIVPRLGPLLHTELLYQVDGNGRAYQLATLYYLLERPSATAISLTPIDPNYQPHMVAITAVQRSQLQFGYQALQVAQHRLKTA